MNSQKKSAMVYYRYKIGEEYRVWLEEKRKQIYKVFYLLSLLLQE